MTRLALHRELVASWRCQTHGDWQHGDMETLRPDIARYLRRYGIPPGPPWRAHPQAGCSTRFGVPRIAGPSADGSSLPGQPTMDGGESRDAVALR